jgi:hypothetical protein
LKLGELLIVALIVGSALTLGLLVSIPILFLLTWARTLRLTGSHQTTSPGLVWLMLVPVFNLGWQFYLLHSATKGVKGRLAELGRDPGTAASGSASPISRWSASWRYSAWAFGWGLTSVSSLACRSSLRS